MKKNLNISKAEVRRVNEALDKHIISMGYEASFEKITHDYLIVGNKSTKYLTGHLLDYMKKLGYSFRWTSIRDGVTCGYFNKEK